MDYKEFAEVSVENAKKMRTAGIVSVMMASAASVPIVGTEYWIWDAFTATLMSVAGIGLALCAISEVQLRLYKRFIRKEPF